MGYFDLVSKRHKLLSSMYVVSDDSESKSDVVRSGILSRYGRISSLVNFKYNLGRAIECRCVGGAEFSTGESVQGNEAAKHHVYTPAV